jgi:hypothetical protein
MGIMQDILGYTRVYQITTGYAKVYQVIYGCETPLICLYWYKNTSTGASFEQLNALSFTDY